MFVSANCFLSYLNKIYTFSFDISHGLNYVGLNYRNITYILKHSPLSPICLYYLPLFFFNIVLLLKPHNDVSIALAAKEFTFY